MERVYVRRRRVTALIIAMLAVAMGAGLGEGVAGVIGAVNNRNHVGTVRLAESGDTTSRSQERQSKQVEASGKAEIKTTPISNAMAGINAVDGSAAVTTTGFTLDDNSRAALDAQIANFTNSGYTTSFVLTDLTTGRTLAYNADTPIYSASAIKA
ncbi:MAG TPA: serine hydrolase, partial [Bifidobacterium sp.]|nr:serine hydrolase [Bifidobacterium sp.]